MRLSKRNRRVLLRTLLLLFIIAIIYVLYKWRPRPDLRVRGEQRVRVIQNPKYPKSIFAEIKSHSNKDVDTSISRYIPHHFHLTTVSVGLNNSIVSSVEERVRLSISSCLEHHYLWEYTVWTDERVRLEFPDLIELLVSIKNSSLLLDLLRMSVLAQKGGIFIDREYICVGYFEGFLETLECNGFSGFENRITNKSNSIVSTGVVGAAPYHPVIEEAASWLRKIAMNHNNISDIYPTLFTGLVNAHRSQPHCIQVLSETAFSPCAYEDRGECKNRMDEFVNDKRVYAVRLWEDI